MLGRNKAGWILMEISQEVRSRAGRVYPVEPVRTLNAIHPGHRFEPYCDRHALFVL